MYVCVDAVRPKCNDFMAPAFAVRYLLTDRDAFCLMLKIFGWKRGSAQISRELVLDAPHVRAKQPQFIGVPLGLALFVMLVGGFRHV